jgi:hypothetical protein
MFWSFRPQLGVRLSDCAFGRGLIHAGAATADEDLSNQRNQRRSVQKGLLGELREFYFALGAFKAEEVLTPPKQARRLQIHSNGATVPGKPLFDTCPLKSLKRKHIAVLHDRGARISSVYAILIFCSNGRSMQRI